MSVEEERKYEVDPKFAVPDLAGCLPAGGRTVPGAPVTLTATYYDTVDLRLARSGASLRHRRGTPARGLPGSGQDSAGVAGSTPLGGAPARVGGARGTEPPEGTWTVKLPGDSPGLRHEISRTGPPGTPPAELVALVAAYTRGAAVGPVVVIRSRRRTQELRDAEDAVLAELADDTVSVLDGRRVTTRFREIEVERVGGGRKLLDRVGAALVAAGATAGRFTPKHVRALGEPAARPPDLSVPVPLGRRPRASEVATGAVRRAVARIVAHDPFVRLRAVLPNGDTPVHQMRVGCRRLRSDLRTFGLLLDPAWVQPLRQELGWLADRLGAARDAEVLRARLRRTAAADPLAPLDDSAVARIDAELAARHAEALDALAAALASDRYLALLDALVAAATAPRLTALAAAPAREVLPRLVARPWRKLAYGSRGVDGAIDLSPGAPDTTWHAVRINGKRARYAVEAVASVVGGEAPALARALAAVQDLLGEHQDAAVSADTWLAVARSDPDDHALAVAAGRLYERERAAIRRVRADFPAAWRAANRRRNVAWLP